MIEFHNVTVNYGKTEGLRSASVDFSEGKFTLLLGPTGSGKSTLLRLIYFDLLPSSGHLSVKKWDSRKIRRKQIMKMRRQVGVIFQDFRLIDNLSVYENVALPLIIQRTPGSEIKSRVHAILDEVGLLERIRHKASDLSGGEQQRVAIARAVVKNPFIILADEPTGNLDPESAFTIFSLLEKINKLGTAVIMATHNYPLIEKSDYRRIYLDAGKILGDE
jgi:cell division transport system ATP-binding protein